MLYLYLFIDLNSLFFFHLHHLFVLHIRGCWIFGRLFFWIFFSGFQCHYFLPNTGSKLKVYKEFKSRVRENTVLPNTYNDNDSLNLAEKAVNKPEYHSGIGDIFVIWSNHSDVVNEIRKVHIPHIMRFLINLFNLVRNIATSSLLNIFYFS